ncbi:hypothetical protein [Cellvibrio sp. UBA7671]|uniref:hypothetical protein n=1 Tax=Cellvibrio sp. UBA7671 TaxID=1946312 RepID=UPI002F35B395
MIRASINTILSPAIIGLLLIGLHSACVKAAENGATATALLQNYLPESCYQTGRYQQEKNLAGLTKLLQTQGSFAFACDKGLLWHTAAPLNETLVYRLQGTTQLIKADGSIQKLSGTLQRHLGQMLNHLLGGDSVYLEKNFVITATESGIRLTPRKKRMEKFLRAIDIARTDADVSIRMQHQGEEYTAIRVYELQTLPALTANQCTQLTGVAASACQQLLAP